MCFHGGGFQGAVASPIGLPQTGDNAITAATDEFRRRRMRAQGFASTILRRDSGSGAGAPLGSKILLGS